MIVTSKTETLYTSKTETLYTLEGMGRPELLVLFGALDYYIKKNGSADYVRAGAIRAAVLKALDKS